VRVLIVTQGKWGRRIADHLRATAPDDWQIADWRGPAVLPVVIDEPGEFLPDALPEADLLLVLTESAGMTDLTPDMAELCDAQAVIVPVDQRSWARPGLRRQVETRLRSKGIGYAFPMPFCSMTPRAGQHPFIRAFAQRYGRPDVQCAVEEGRIVSCEVLREAPCGNTRFVAEHLQGVPAAEVAEQAGLLHHYYPCWGGMETDPVHGTHTLLHVAATMTQGSIGRAVGKETHVSH
jgi:thymidylate synthase